jgi:FkbM family methyltransferase
MIEGVNILGAKCVVVHYERLLTNPEEEIRKILQKIGLDFYPEMIEYGKHDLPRWPAGDQNSVYRYTKPNSQNLEDWKLELKHPIMWKLANTYLEILGETTIERMGYSYQEIRTILTECKPSLLWMVSMTSISQSVLTRLHRFLHQSWQERVQSVRFRLKRVWNRIVPFAPLPVRLPFGSWWLAWNDVCSDAIFTGGFEEAEWHFVERFLQPGMTVLDIGAHHGFYTLLASQKVGPDGKVVAFEPSPRERKRLLWHLRLNRCRNVQVETFALGSREGEAELFLVVGKDTGCNSLRLPNVTEPIRLVRVPVVQLDDYLRQNFIEHVDFIKMDVEGAELEVLKGATELLQRKPLPVWLVEVEDVRTQPWGYKAVEIIKFLRQFGYHWFKPLADGSLIPIRPTQEQYDGNLVAVPEERLEQLQGLVKEVSHDEVSPSVH